MRGEPLTGPHRGWVMEAYLQHTDSAAWHGQQPQGMAVDRDQPVYKFANCLGYGFRPFPPMCLPAKRVLYPPIVYKDPLVQPQTPLYLNPPIEQRSVSERKRASTPQHERNHFIDQAEEKANSTSCVTRLLLQLISRTHPSHLFYS